MGAKVKLAYPEIDIQKTKREIHKTMTKFVIKEALPKWLGASVDVIPVWSGASRASFIKLANAASTRIEVNPVAPSRIPLGIALSTGDVFAIPGSTYGWEWESKLEYISIVEGRVDFINVGVRSIQNLKVELPQPVLKRDNSND